MSSSATVPVIGPDGNTYDMPHDCVADAIAKGGELAMDIIGPDNKTYPIPLDQVHAALAQGGTLKPPAMPAAPIPQGLQPTPTLQPSSQHPRHCPAWRSVATTHAGAGRAQSPIRPSCRARNA